MTSSSPIADYTIPAVLQSHLSRTFAPLTTMIPLSGGFSYYTYRAHLPTAKTVVIKHAEPFAALHRDIPLSTTRVGFERTALSFPPPTITTAAGFTVTTPQVLHYDEASHTLVVADAGVESIGLKALLLSSAVGLDAGELGTALGTWLHRLHTWGRTDAAAPLREALAGNTHASMLWTWATYVRLVETIQLLPGAGLEDAEGLFAEIAAAATAEQKAEQDTIIHGDFWCGNILLQGSGGGAMVADWEMARMGGVWADLAQMCAELYLPWQFRGVETGVKVLRGFLSAYGRVSEEVARRIVVHFGVHLVIWPVRSGWGVQEEAERCAIVGREFIERGWRRDWRSVKESVLGELVDESWIV